MYFSLQEHNNCFLEHHTGAGHAAERRHRTDPHVHDLRVLCLPGPHGNSHGSLRIHQQELSVQGREGEADGRHSRTRRAGGSPSLRFWTSSLQIDSTNAKRFTVSVYTNRLCCVFNSHACTAVLIFNFFYILKCLRGLSILRSFSTSFTGAEHV